MSILVNLGALSSADGRHMEQMDSEDRTALRLCLFSAGALAGLSLRGNFTRRLAALGCSILTAGLAIPLAKEYIEELRKSS